ncbi:hypothetical protein [Candidatus Methanodesulfokora washburnensis]|jgi:hypothetical protein|uniref:Uncharacterized protein n=1 Tax=Candidatus Methanodesulfokora washburnensis TaxID=2478471 RepID=A0A429GI71_9CREN|nr:hypothetical protein [Candidatus Methanodesulfokores washburnensis]RSN73467.1 hypothetical protein D6D85_10275 [Candidatus Methanodesulfokores washburnensis]
MSGSKSLDDIVERPEEYFISGTAVWKYFDWLDYTPLRLAVKRTEYIKSLEISRETYKKLSGMLNIQQALLGMGIGLKLVEKGLFTSSTSFTCKNSPLIGGRIGDTVVGSNEAGKGQRAIAVEFYFPCGVNYFEGEIRAIIKGLEKPSRFVDVQIYRMIKAALKGAELAGIEMSLDSERMLEKIKDDPDLIELVTEFFESQGPLSANPWSPHNKIDLSVRKGGYNAITFTLPHLYKLDLKKLIEKGIDFHRVPELMFDISEIIAKKVV